MIKWKMRIKLFLLVLTCVYLYAILQPQNKINDSTSFTLQDIDSKNLSVIQLNYLNIGDGQIFDDGKNNFYSSVSNYTAYSYPDIKVNVDSLIQFLKSAKPLKKELGIMSYEFNGHPETLTLFLTFTSSVETNIDVNIKCIINNNGTVTIGDNLITVEVNDELLYYKKTNHILELFRRLIYACYNGSHQYK